MPMTVLTNEYLSCVHDDFYAKLFSIKKKKLFFFFLQNFNMLCCFHDDLYVNLFSIKKTFFSQNINMHSSDVVIPMTEVAKGYII